jgi:hypothetical protein
MKNFLKIDGEYGHGKGDTNKVVYITPELIGNTILKNWDNLYKIPYDGKYLFLDENILWRSHLANDYSKSRKR